jgi:hypothetical protein
MAVDAEALQEAFSVVRVEWQHICGRKTGSAGGSVESLHIPRGGWGAHVMGMLVEFG